jgi:HSP20 family protein
MAIYRWRPGFDFYQMQREMNRLFDEFYHQAKGEEENVSSAWSPNVDIVEHDQEILLVAELPGVSKKDIKLSVSKGVLTLSGEKQAPELAKDDCLHCTERFFGPFERKFTLPITVAEDKIKADFKDGLLKISLPKAEETKPKEITIKAE